MRVTWSIGRDLYPTRGFGLVTRGGNLGTQAGDPRTRLFREVEFLIWWPIVLHMHWIEPLEHASPS